MRPRIVVIAGVILNLAGCGRSADQDAVEKPAVQNVAANLAAPVTATEARAEGGVPGEPRASLAEPKGPIDPKSVEAAGQVVQHYGALVERHHWLKAEKLWSDFEAARKFAVALSAQIPVAHVEIGDLGPTEGAAGSIYTTVPVTFYGPAKSGRPERRKADIVLRRVNDVPGSTEKQRQWHIERIDWKTA
jgi:hypothetical protein